jgi:hypothetical protein
LVNNCLNCPPVPFTIWPEPDLVAAVEMLVEAGKHDEAYTRLYAMVLASVLIAFRRRIGSKKRPNRVTLGHNSDLGNVAKMGTV